MVTEGNQVRLDNTTRAFNFIWVAVSSKGTVVKGKEERPVKNPFYGDRSGTLRDPFGHQWTLATHKEDLSPQEMERRMAEAMKQGQ